MHRTRVRSIEFDDRWMQMRARSRHARTRGHTVGRTHAYTRSVGHTHAHVRVLYHEIVPCVRCVTLTHTHARARPHSTVCDLSMRTRTYPPPDIHIHMRVDRATFRGARPGATDGFRDACVSVTRAYGWFSIPSRTRDDDEGIIFFVLLRIYSLH